MDSRFGFLRTSPKRPNIIHSSPIIVMSPNPRRDVSIGRNHLPSVHDSGVKWKMDLGISMRDVPESFRRGIVSKKLKVTVIGAGYVGLPTSALISDKGFHVVISEIDKSIIRLIRKGRSPFNEPGLDEIISHNLHAKRIRAIKDARIACKNADVVMIAVQTPLGADKGPELSALRSLLGSISANLKKGVLVILISTVPPGSTRGWVRKIIERESGFKLEKDYFLAYSPERMAPGSAISEVVRNPRLVGGVGRISTKLASLMIQVISPITIETDSTSAEVAKLAENASRDLNIAFTNQLAIICEQLGVDVLEVIRIANTHPRVRLLSPGPGVGGPCLTKDGYFLIADRKKGLRDLVILSREINDQMAIHIESITLDAISEAGKKAEKCKIAMLGVAYKANIEDTRESPSIRIIKGICHDVSSISVFDPYVKKIPGLNHAPSIESCVKNADCLIIGTDHNEFRHLNLRRIMKDMNASPIIIDTRRIIDPDEAIRHGFTYIGVGYGHTEMDDMDCI